VHASRKPPQRDGREAERERDLGVTVDHEVHRGPPVEAQAVDALARRATRMRTGGRRGRAGEDRQGAQRR
jgi:hypothetical protein